MCQMSREEQKVGSRTPELAGRTRGIRSSTTNVYQQHFNSEN